MGQIDKLIEKMQKEPTPPDVTYLEVKKILSHLGYQESTKGKTSGSRVKFYCPNTGDIILLHRPHPKGVMKKGAIRQLIISLKEKGLL